MKKKILCLVIMGIVSGNMTTFAANNNKNVEAPLRLSDDRSELIDRLTEEDVGQKLNPTSVEEIRKIKKETLETQEEIEKSAHNPDALFRTIVVESNNSMEQRDIFLSPNYATTLIFLDKRGNYWPIESFVLPLPDSVISRDVINTGIMVLTPKKYSTKGNLIVMLKDSKLPLMLTLNVGTEKIDYKTELRINDYGPNSQVTSYSSSSNSSQFADLSNQSKFTDEDRVDLLNGITPNEYKKRESSVGSVEAWTNGKTLFLKTKEYLLTPKPILEEGKYNILKGSDGSYLYTVPFMPEILLSVSGNIVPVRIK